MKMLGSKSRKVPQSLQKLMLNFCFVIQPHSGSLSDQDKAVRLGLDSAFFRSAVTSNENAQVLHVFLIIVYNKGYMKYLPEGTDGGCKQRSKIRYLVRKRMS